MTFMRIEKPHLLRGKKGPSKTWKKSLQPEAKN